MALFFSQRNWRREEGKGKKISHHRWQHSIGDNLIEKEIKEVDDSRKKRGYLSFALQLQREDGSFVSRFFDLS